MTRPTHLQPAAQKCSTPRCCLWPRKAKWWCGYGIRSIHKRAGRGLGLRVNFQTSFQLYRREARHELTSSRWEEWRNGAERPKTCQEREEKVANRSSRRNRHRRTAIGEAALGPPLVRADRSCGVGTILRQDLCRGGSLALGDTDSGGCAQPGGEGG